MRTQLFLYSSCGTLLNARNINFINIVQRFKDKEQYQYKYQSPMIHHYNQESIAQILANHYALKGTITQMAGYTDQNFLLKIQRDGKVFKYTIKVSSSLQNKRLIELQNYVFKQLQLNKNKFGPCQFPILVPNLQNQDMIVFEKQGKYNFIRVLTFIEGKQIWQIEDAPLHLFVQAGTMTANLSLFLSSISNNEELKERVYLQSEDYYSNICTFNHRFQKYYDYLDAKLKPLVANIKQEFNSMLPLLKTIPKQIIHGDICLSNILVNKNQKEEWFISGLIDFGYSIYSYQIIELVILCARMNLCLQQPLRNMLLMIGAYNQVRKLSQIQKAVLFPLIKTRLAFLCLLSSFLAHDGKNDPYLIKCKKGQILYLETLANYCTNQEFLQRLEASL